MKLKLVPLVLFAVFSFSASQSPGLDVSLNGEWDFTFKLGVSMDVPTLPPPADFDVKLRVPDYMNMQTDRLSKAKWWRGSKSVKYKALRGMAFYKKTFKASAKWKRRTVRLEIGRVYDRANVWLNGKHLGFYPYACFTPVLIDLTGKLRLGATNQLVISVDNKKELEQRYFKYGGIVAPVSLKISSGIGRIEDLYIHSARNSKESIWRCELNIPFKNRTLRNSTLLWAIKDVANGKILRKATRKVKSFNNKIVLEWKVPRKNLKTWHPNSPNLYLAEIKWIDSKGKPIDAISQKFGLRVWSSTGRTLELNGKPIYLRQLFGYPERTHWRYPQDKDYWLKFYTKMKGFGYNSADWEGSAPSQAALDAADEVGFVVQTGYIYGAGKSRSNMINSETKKIDVDKLVSTWSNIVSGTRRHPSMSIYYPFAEENYYHGMIADLKRINDTVKKLHPASLFLPNQALRGVEYSFLKGDDITKKPFPHHAGRLAEMSKFVDLFGQYPPGGIFSYFPLNVSWKEANKWFTAYKRPLISHEVMMCQYFGTPYSDDLQYDTLRYGRKEMDRLCYVWGFPASKATLEKRLTTQKKYPGNYLELSEASSKLNSILSKYVFEKLRKCDNVTGYQDIGVSGGINILNQIRPGFSKTDFLKYNNDNVLLLDFDDSKCLKRCYWEGEDFHATAMVSVYGGTPVSKGRIVLRITTMKGVELYKKLLSANDAPNGKVTNLTNIDFKWPKVPKNTKVRLQLTLKGANGFQLNNDWSFWIFKKPLPLNVDISCSFAPCRLLRKHYRGISFFDGTSAPKQLLVTDNVGEKEIAHLENGGDLLILGGSPFSLNSDWPYFAQGYRSWHNHGNKIDKLHPVFADLPNEGWSDWQFYPLIEGRPSVNLDKLPSAEKLPLIVTKIIRGAYRKETMMFEFKAGKGRAFLTTFQFDMSNPACATLMRSILKYVSGPEFKPTGIVDINTLKMLAGSSAPTIAENKIELPSRIFTGGVFYKKYASFGIVPRDGVCASPGQSLKLLFNLKKDQIPTTQDKRLIFSIDGQDCDKPGETRLKIMLNRHLLYEGKCECVKRGWSIHDIPFSKKLLNIGMNDVEIVNETKGRNWFMLAGITIKPSASTGARKTFAEKTALEWTNKMRPVSFKRAEWRKLNNGRWRKTQKISFEKEGVNVIYRKNGRKGRAVKEKTIAIDVTPPVLTLRANPRLLQLGGEYFAKPGTTFKIEASDALSGVKSTLMSIDSAKFKPVGKSFKLSPGSHSIRCKAIDNAGNVQTIFTGGLEGGSTTDCFNIQVKTTKRSVK